MEPSHWVKSSSPEDVKRIALPDAIHDAQSPAVETLLGLLFWEDAKFSPDPNRREHTGRAFRRRSTRIRTDSRLLQRATTSPPNAGCQPTRSASILFRH